MESLGLIAGSGWASGVNLYGVALLLGLFGRLGMEQVPDLLEHPATLTVVGVMYLLEFVADKVPYLDNVWDIVHTAVRPLGAALIGYLLAGEVQDVNELLSASGSGVLALASHGTKATARAAINTSPEPASNIVVSLFEDGLVAAVVWFAVEYPVLAVALVAALLVAGTVVVVMAVRAARGIARRIRERFRGQSLPGT